MKSPSVPTRRLHRTGSGDSEKRSEELLRAANESAGVARNLYITVLGSSLFIAIVTGGLNDEALLRDSAVPLPLIEKTNLPLSSFYLIAPWLLIFLHAELLMHLAILATKLRRFDSTLTGMKEEAARHQRVRLTSFLFMHWLVGGDADRTLRWLHGVNVWLTVILLPLTVLVFAQIGFLPYQDETITWSQRFSVLADVLLIGFFWPSIVAPGIGRSQWWVASLRWWLNIWRWFERLPPQAGCKWPVRLTRGPRGGLRIVLASLVAMWLVWIAATIPQEWWERKLIEWNKALGGVTLTSENITRIKPRISCLTLAGNREIYGTHVSDESGGIFFSIDDPNVVDLPESMEVLCPTALLFHRQKSATPHFTRTITLPESVLIGNDAPPETLARAGGREYNEKEKALWNLKGLNLRGRTLRFANFDGARLYRVDLRDAELEGATLTAAQLDYADLRGARLREASLDYARLQAANLSFAKLQGARLTNAQLQGALLLNADLSGAVLGSAGLEGADLTGVYLDGADLRGAQLQGADLSNARIRGAMLSSAQLQGATLEGVMLQGTDLVDAELILNDRVYLLTGRWEPKTDAPLGNIADRFKAAGWVTSYMESIQARAGKDTAGIKLKKCLGDIKLGCEKKPTLELMIERANLFARLACDTDPVEAVAIAHRKLVGEFSQVLGSQPMDANKEALIRTLAKRLADPACAGRPAFSTAELKRIDNWARDADKRKRPTAPHTPVP